MRCPIKSTMPDTMKAVNIAVCCQLFMCSVQNLASSRYSVLHHRTRLHVVAYHAHTQQSTQSLSRHQRQRSGNPSDTSTNVTGSHANSGE